MSDNDDMGGDDTLNSTRRSLGGLKASFKVDSSAVRELTSDFKKLHDTLKNVKKELSEISTLSKSVGIGSGGSANAAFGATVSPTQKISQVSQGATASSGVVSSGGGGGGFVNFLTKVGGGSGGFGAPSTAGIGAAAIGAAAIGEAIGSAIKPMISAISNRVDRGYAYSLSADKMSTLYQQMSGMSNLQADTTYRQPLVKYRLGEGGINQLLELQANTGLKNQASSIEALRTSSGFGLSTQSAVNMATSMSSAPVANRMFFTTGMSMYGIGGKENNMMDVIKNLVQSSGLTDDKFLKGAMQQGSVARQRLAYTGLPEDMQNAVLQYAQENAAFKKKGGTGMYDPSDRKQQRMMGISDNFAVQKEETTRVGQEREENFYRRQADNFSSLEKKTQGLIKIFGKLEDTLQGVIGNGISNKNKLGAASSIGGAVGGGLLAIGAGLTASGAGAEIGLPLLALGGFLKAVTGDPKPATPGIGTAAVQNVTIPTYGKPMQLSDLPSNSSFSGMHPTFKDRLTKMMSASGGRVGFGEGKRSQDTQRQGFLERHEQSSEKTDTFWEGKYWKLKKGYSPMAPPGMSMHEIGLAADLVGDMDWVAANAEKFGLKAFGNVPGVNEPWHVQPSELPNSRSQYEKQGASWGSDGKFNTTSTFGGTNDVIPTDSSGGSGSVGNGGILHSYSGMSIPDAIEAFRNDTLHASGVQSVGSATPGQSFIAPGNTTSTQALSGAMSGKSIVQLLKSAGFKGDDLTKAVGISWRESRWTPTAFTHVNRDQSYGLFQINMKDDDPKNPGMGADRRKHFNLSKNELLFDPKVNAAVAHQMQSESGWGPWSIKGNPNAGWDAGMAARTVQDAGGDPKLPSRNFDRGEVSSGRTSTHYVSGDTYNIPVTVNLVSSGSTASDSYAIAREVGKIIESEARMKSLRRS